MAELPTAEELLADPRFKKLSPAKQAYALDQLRTRREASGPAATAAPSPPSGPVEPTPKIAITPPTDVPALPSRVAPTGSVAVPSPTATPQQEEAQPFEQEMSPNDRASYQNYLRGFEPPPPNAPPPGAKAVDISGPEELTPASIEGYRTPRDAQRDYIRGGLRSGTLVADKSGQIHQKGAIPPEQEEGPDAIRSAELGLGNAWRRWKEATQEGAVRASRALQAVGIPKGAADWVGLNIVEPAAKYAPVAAPLSAATTAAFPGLAGLSALTGPGGAALRLAARTAIAGLEGAVVGGTTEPALETAGTGETVSGEEVAERAAEAAKGFAVGHLVGGELAPRVARVGVDVGRRGYRATMGLGERLSDELAGRGRGLDISLAQRGGPLSLAELRGGPPSVAPYRGGGARGGGLDITAALGGRPSLGELRVGENPAEADARMAAQSLETRAAEPEYTLEQQAERYRLGRGPMPPGYIGPEPVRRVPGGEFIGPRQEATRPFTTVPGEEGRGIFVTRPGGEGPFEVTTARPPGEQPAGGRAGPTYLDLANQRAARAEQAARALVPRPENLPAVAGPTPFTSAAGTYPTTSRRLDAAARAAAALQGQPTGAEVAQLGQAFERERTGGGRDTVGGLREELRTQRRAMDRAAQVSREEGGTGLDVTTGPPTNLPAPVPTRGPTLVQGQDFERPAGVGGPSQLTPEQQATMEQLAKEEADLAAQRIPREPRAPRPSGPAGGGPRRPPGPEAGAVDLGSAERIAKTDDDRLAAALAPTPEDAALWRRLLRSGQLSTDKEFAAAVAEATGGPEPPPESIYRLRRVLALQDTDRPSYQTGELTAAIRTKNGDVHYDTRALNHAEVMRNMGVDPDDVADTGYIVRGEYRPGNPVVSDRGIVDVRPAPVPDWVKETGKVEKEGTGITEREKEVTQEARDQVLVRRVTEALEGDTSEDSVRARMEWIEELLDDPMGELDEKTREGLADQLVDLENFEKLVGQGRAQYGERPAREATEEEKTGLEPASPEQKFAPEEHPVSREELRAKGYIVVKKYSDLHKHGYNIVVWRTARGATPEEAHWVYEYVPREKGSPLPRRTANAEDRALQEEIERSVGYDAEAEKLGRRQKENPFQVGDRVKVRGLGEGVVERSWKSGKVSVRLDDGRIFERHASSGDLRPAGGEAPKVASVEDAIRTMREGVERDNLRLDEAFDDIPIAFRTAVHERLNAAARRYSVSIGRPREAWRAMDSHLSPEQRLGLLDTALTERGEEAAPRLAVQGSKDLDDFTPEEWQGLRDRLEERYSPDPVPTFTSQTMADLAKVANDRDAAPEKRDAAHDEYDAIWQYHQGVERGAIPGRRAKVAPTTEEEEKPAAPAEEGRTQLRHDDPLVTMPDTMRRAFARIATRLTPEDASADLNASQFLELTGAKWAKKMEKAGYWDRESDRLTPKFIEDYRRWHALQDARVEYLFDPSSVEETPARYEGVEDTRPGKPAFEAVSQMASDDPTRINLNGVYVDKDGFIVATNAHAMVIAPAKPRGLTAGKVYDDAGKVVEAEFPDWRQVVPEQRIDVGELTAAQLEALGGTPRRMDPSTKSPPVLVIPTSDGDMYVSAEYLERLGGIMRELGVDRVTVERGKAEEGAEGYKGDPLIQPLVITETDPPKGKQPVQALLMPMRADESARNVTRWDPSKPLEGAAAAPPKGRRGGGGGGGGRRVMATSAGKEWPNAENAIVFRSGASRPAEFEGFTAAGRAPGVVIDELSGPMRKRAAEAIFEGHPIFVDSGAFSKDMDAAEFKRVLGKYGQLLDLSEQEAEGLGAKHIHQMQRGWHFVMPDVVGDQAESLRLQRELAGEIKTLQDRGASILVPIQRGELSLGEVYRQLKRGLGTDDFTVALPMNKVKIPEAELLRFARDEQPSRIHLLGLGDEDKLAELREKIQDATGENTIVTGDATRLKQLVGKGKPVTEAGRKARAAGEKTGARARAEELARQDRLAEPRFAPDVLEGVESGRYEDVSPEMWTQLARWAQDAYGHRMDVRDVGAVETVADEVTRQAKEAPEADRDELAAAANALKDYAAGLARKRIPKDAFPPLPKKAPDRIADMPLDKLEENVRRIMRGRTDRESIAGAVRALNEQADDIIMGRYETKAAKKAEKALGRSVAPKVETVMKTVRLLSRFADEADKGNLKYGAVKETEVPTPDEILAQHPGAKESRRLYDSTAPRGEVPEGTERKQADNVADAVFQTQEAIRLAKEAGDLAEQQRLEESLRRMNAGFKGPGWFKRFLQKRKLLPPEGVREAPTAFGRNPVLALLNSAQFFTRKHPIFSRIVNLMQRAEDAKSVLRYEYLESPGTKGDHLTGGAHAILNQVTKLPQEQRDLFWPTALESDYKEEHFSAEDLAARGLSPRAIQVYRALEGLLKRFLDERINPLRIRQGKEPIPGHQGMFLPHKWFGVYELFDQDGNRLMTPGGQSSFTTRRDAWAAAQEATKHDPSITTVHLQPRYQDMADMFDDPDDAAAARRLIDYLQQTDKELVPRAELALRQQYLARGFPVHLEHRKNVPGYELSRMPEAIVRYLEQGTGWVSRVEPREEIRNLLRYVRREDDPASWDTVETAIDAWNSKQGRIEQNIDNIIRHSPIGLFIDPRRPTRRLLGGWRQGVMHWKVGIMSPASALLNSTDFIRQAGPILGPRYALSGVRAWFDATPEQARIAQLAERARIFEPKVFGARIGETPTAERLARAKQLSLGPFGWFERNNRFMTALGAAERVLKKGPEDRIVRFAWDGDKNPMVRTLVGTHYEWQPFDPTKDAHLVEFMRRVVDKTMFRYDTTDRIKMFQGPVGQMFGQFKQYTTNSWELQKRYWDLRKRGSVEGMAPMMQHAGIGLLFGGAMSIPQVWAINAAFRWFSHDRQGPIDKLVKWMVEQETKHGPESWQARGSKFAAKGWPAIFNVDASQRIGTGDIVPYGPGGVRWRDFMPAAANSSLELLDALSSGDLKGAAETVPTLRTLLKLRSMLMSHEVRDKAGRLLYTPDITDYIAAATGVTTVKETTARTIGAMAEQQYRLQRERRKDMGLKLLDAQDAPDPERERKLWQQAQDQNLGIDQKWLTRFRKEHGMTAEERAVRRTPKVLRPEIEKWLGTQAERAKRALGGR